MDAELLYLRLHDEIKAREALQVRVDALEHFIREKFPGDFAGEVGTIADPDLNPVLLNVGSPMTAEQYNNQLNKVMNGLPR
jgi:hypothetical protein